MSSIRINKLSKVYDQKKVLDNICLQINAGHIYGLIGHNGAGKTTLMKVLAGIVLPTEGEVYIDSMILNEKNGLIRRKVGFVIENSYFDYNLSAYENLKLQTILHGGIDNEQILHVLKLTGLNDAGNKKIKEYSLGMKQRLGIAGAILGKPDVLILDEPMNGLDPEGIHELRTMLQKLQQREQITILISSHLLEELYSITDDFIFMSRGKVIEQISIDNLREKFKKKIMIHTINDDRAFEIMTNQFGSQKIIKTNTFIKLDIDETMVESVSRTLYENNIIPVHISVEGERLEDYYMKIMGDKK